MALPCLHVITDEVEIAAAATRAVVRLGVPDRLAIQVRVKGATDRAAFELTAAILAVTRPAGVLCLVNDRLDVAVAAGADGAHVGAEDLPVGAARRVLGASAVLGATCREPAAARAAVADGASYLGVGPAYPTVTKAGLPAPLGPGRVGEVARAVPGTPVVAIGGVTAGNAVALLEAGVAGVAVVGAVSGAADPGAAVAELLAAVGPR